ncbi:MAG TPA: hypothetical protein VIG74_05565 [Alphaproteobacteria bacterium]|jgi:hypothetical protein
MRKFFVLAVLLCLLPPPAHAAEDAAALRALYDADLKKLDFVCADDYAQEPAEEIVKTLERFWYDIRGGKEVPDEDIACRLRTLVGRGHIDRKWLTVYAYGFTQPAYAAYFLTVLERDRPGSETRMLAGVYARDGAVQDIPRATRMFRMDATSLLSVRDTPEECTENLLSMRKESNEPLHNAQFEWAASLCEKPEEELSDLAKTLSQPGDVNDQITADHINSFIYWNWTIKQKTEQLDRELSKGI